MLPESASYKNLGKYAVGLHVVEAEITRRA